MNKLRLDHQATRKLRLGLAAMYMMTAEDVVYLDTAGVRQSHAPIGFEIDADMSYKLYANLTFNLAAGYLIAGDAMDFFEEAAIRDGDADKNIVRVMISVRYKL